MGDTKKEKDIKEWAGAGVNGAPSFQGVAYGYGGRAQLAGPPRPLPDDFEHIIDDLVADELNDMFGGSEKPIWTKDATLKERNASDANYSHLGGSPGGDNALVAKRDFIPVDPSEQDNVDFLGPTVDGIALKDIEGNTSNNWKSVNLANRGRLNMDLDSLVKNQELPEGMVSGGGKSPWGSFSPNKLVAPKDWTAETEKNVLGDMDAKNPLGGMGVVQKPIAFVPNSAENQVKMDEETENGDVINTQRSKKMSSNKKDDKLEEVESMGTPEQHQRLIQQMTALAQKHGGKGLEDYERVVPQAEKDQMTKQGNMALKVGGLKQAAQDRQTRQKMAAAQKNAPLVQGLKGLAGKVPPAGQQQQQQKPQDVKFFPPPPLSGTLKEDLEPGLQEAAKELALFITNDEQLYVSGILPAVKNLRKKVDKGTYQDDLALKLWFLVASAGAQKYAKEFGMEPWHKHFPTSVRVVVAKELQHKFNEIVKGAH